MNRQSSQVSLRDLRSMYLLLGECQAVAHLPELWCRRLHEELVQLLHVHVSTFFFADANRVRGLSPPHPKDTAFAFGWDSPADEQHAWEYFRSGGVMDDPIVKPWSQIQPARATLVRQALAPDDVWYGCDSYNNVYRACDTDQMIISRCPLPGGRAMLMNLWRRVGEPPFTQREARFVRLLHHEVERMYGRAVSVSTQAVICALPPRARQVLGLLLEGLSEKEVARVMSISPHSVHDHIKTLHRRLGVSNRAELLARATYRLRV